MLDVDLNRHVKAHAVTKRILAIFFHPHHKVTAVGGAEKRFIEILKVWSKNVPITILESQPSLLERYGVNSQRYTLSSPLAFRKDKWLTIYLEWILWTLKACLHSFSLIPKRHQYGLILAPNNTLPTLLTSYFFHLVLSRPICAVVHHLDTYSLFPANTNTIYQTYRKTGYSKTVAFIKTLAFQITLFLLKHVNACITVSTATADSLIQRGISKSKIFVSSNGVNFQHIRMVKGRERKLLDGVFVGRIAREKGVFDLVFAWQKIVKANRNAQLIIIGSGPDLKKLKAAIAKTRLQSNILVKGRLNDEEMYAVMKACKVFIFPSRFEGWGLAVAEALASGLPVVCYAIPALKEVFGECKNVFLVPVGNIEKLAQTVLKVLSMKSERLGEISKRYAKRFEWDKVAMDDLQVIKQVMD